MGRSFTPSPLEWLLGLAESGGHGRLLAREGNLAAAAWLLARARCLTSEHPSEVPSAREVRGAAREILLKSQKHLEVPSLGSLTRDCEAIGLPVL